MEVTAEDFAILHEACTALEARRIPYVVGGGTAVVLWGRQRRTKDFDIFLPRLTQRRAMDALSQAGFTTSDTEKSWLFKAWRGDTLVDLIMVSRGGVTVTSETMRHARLVLQHGFVFRVMGPEDVLFRKILTLTEGRPDWHDALSILVRMEGKLDWDYFLTLARPYVRRILGFMLFARTELHTPPGRLRATPDELYRGDAPGPVPEWVFRRLLALLQQPASVSEPPRALPWLPRAA